MSHYDVLIQQRNESAKQHEKIKNIRIAIERNGSRFLSGVSSESALIPSHLVSEFDALLEKVDQHYQSQHDKARHLILSVEKLLEALEAKK